MMLFAAFYMLFMHDPTPKTLLIAGALLGYSVITEYPSFLIVLVLMGYALYRVLSTRNATLLAAKSAPSNTNLRQLLQMAWLIAPLAACALGLMAYNNAIFGGPFKLGYGQSELWHDQHSQGFMSLTYPHLAAIWGITFSAFRGLFVLSPLLLLALPGFWRWLRSGVFRAEAIVCFLATFTMFLFNSSSIMWWGGWSVGPRYLIPGLPFMVVAIIFVLTRETERSQTRFLKSVLMRETWFVIAGLLFIWSLIATWGITLAEQQFPPDTIPNPYTSYALPNWLAGNIARNWGSLMGLRGVNSLVPLILAVAVLGTIAIHKNRQTAKAATRARDNSAPVRTIEPKAL
ncbi:MAG: hypothetical protein HC853_06795 [Anaerolineae bacterium]|nr:hypothetical protein [Anaerolineae bacterium]